MKSPTYSSDGDEIAIIGGGHPYATVFLSQDRRRVGIRLEQCKSWGKPHVVYVDSKAIPDMIAAFQQVAARLA